MIELDSRDLKYSLTEREKYLSQLDSSAYAGVLLHTCNRVEVYRGTGDTPIEVVRHLFRVVSGIESALPGETAIQGQVKDAYEKARKSLQLSSQLHKLFQNALFVGKRVRSETNISKGAMSHGKAVIEILKQDAVELSGLKILIIGVNNLNEAVVKYLTEKGNNTVFIANRTYKKALELSNKYGCKTVRFNQLSTEMCSADIVVSATSSPHLIIKREDFITNRKMIMFDLAVPRDIDPEIGNLPCVTLYNIEDIEKRINVNRGRRIAEVKKAENIIEEEIGIFYAGK